MSNTLGHGKAHDTGLTERQKSAIREMAELERQYGRKFLLNSLHKVRFDYQALERIARGIDK
jgi:hypothetical protein